MKIEMSGNDTMKSVARAVTLGFVIISEGYCLWNGLILLSTFLGIALVSTIMWFTLDTIGY